MSERNPWADPSTPTETGVPYAGPPAATPYGTGGYPGGGYPGGGYPGHPGYPGYGAPGPYGYGYPSMPSPYGYPAQWWPARPTAPRRPGQLITSAVLAFVQAGLVLLASLYVWFFASVVDIVSQDAGFPAAADGLAAEGTIVAIVQVVSSALLVWAGIWALTRRTRLAWRLLLAAHAVQIGLAVYWAIRLSMLSSDAPGPDPSGALIVFTALFAAMPLVGLGLVAGGPGKRWFEEDVMGRPAVG